MEIDALINPDEGRYADLRPTTEREGSSEREIERMMMDISGDVRVMAVELKEIQRHLAGINGKVGLHQSWIDKREGQIAA